MESESVMNQDLWLDLSAKLRRGMPLAVATIATSDGSTPRSAGAKMLVDPTGLVAGTLGGGAAEAKALDIAQETIADGKPRLFTIDMSGTAKSGADLICGGVVRIFVQRLEPAFADAFALVAERLLEGQDSYLMTPLAGWAKPILVTPDTDVPELAAIIEESANGASIVKHQDAEFLWEPIPAPCRLIIAGGGHVSLATARVASLTGFDVTVMDDREEFANTGRFPWLAANRILVVPGYRNCLSEQTLGFPVIRTCCIAIMTRGHSNDTDVLAEALRTPAGYVGMIGSRRKRDSVYRVMMEKGFSREAIDRVYSPIGLPLGGETPEDIAVSIVAQLVTVRAKGFPQTKV